MIQRQIDLKTMKTSKKAAKQHSASSPLVFNAVCATGPASKKSNTTNSARGNRASTLTSDMEDTMLDAEEREVQEAFAKAEKKLKEVRRRKEEREAAAKRAAEEAAEVTRRRSTRNSGIANELLMKQGVFTALLGKMLQEGEKEVLGMFLDSWTKDLRGSLGIAQRDEKPKVAIKEEPGLEEPSGSGVHSSMSLLDEDEEDAPRVPAKRRKIGGLVKMASTIPASATPSIQEQEEELSDIE
ncbi:hypothetical protein BJ508DRAFT_305005 [Ascobolus immersus RN42]|uniref:Uncharacterized protein n=1 Tax=Ascobolus immersus RN42 TaxID=1160509 RepID=A0A3N4INV0_ASCIM|nr:hypothetical protein BJ508DRAFT_305005 [Ascobolus immersus RN42]